MKPLSPLEIEMLLLCAGIRPEPNHVRPRIVEEPIPGRQYEPGPCAAVIGKEMAPVSNKMIGHVSFYDCRNRVSVSAHTLPKECPVLISVSSGDADVNVHLSLESTHRLIKSLEEIVAVLDAAQEAH
jgi:hypothetical protein